MLADGPWTGEADATWFRSKVFKWRIMKPGLDPQNLVTTIYRDTSLTTPPAVIKVWTPIRKSRRDGEERLSTAWLVLDPLHNCWIDVRLAEISYTPHHLNRQSDMVRWLASLTPRSARGRGFATAGRGPTDLDVIICQLLRLASHATSTVICHKCK